LSAWTRIPGRRGEILLAAIESQLGLSCANLLREIRLSQQPSTKTPFGASFLLVKLPLYEPWPLIWPPAAPFNVAASFGTAVFDICSTSSFLRRRASETSGPPCNIFRLCNVALLIPYRRHDSVFSSLDSCSRKTWIICSAVYGDRFFVRLPPTDFRHIWMTFRGSCHRETAGCCSPKVVRRRFANDSRSFSNCGCSLLKTCRL